MKEFVRSKRGDVFTVLLTMIGVMILITILVSLSSNYSDLVVTFNKAGSQAAFILSTYDEADTVLLYVDNQPI